MNENGPSGRERKFSANIACIKGKEREIIQGWILKVGTRRKSDSMYVPKGGFSRLGLALFSA
jgi:hypothetical protein